MEINSKETNFKRILIDQSCVPFFQTLIFIAFTMSTPALSTSPIAPEKGPLLVEEAIIITKKPGFFERLFPLKFLSIKFLAFACGFLIFCALIIVIGHLARFTRVLINEKKTVDGHGIDNDLFNKFNLFEQYSAAAYCPLNFNSSNSKITCAAGNCPLVEAADTNTQVEFAQ
jgi:hypothetical protein